MYAKLKLLPLALLTLAPIALGADSKIESMPKYSRSVTLDFNAPEDVTAEVILYYGSTQGNTSLAIEKTGVVKRLLVHEFTDSAPAKNGHGTLSFNTNQDFRRGILGALKDNANVENGFLRFYAKDGKFAEIKLFLVDGTGLGDAPLKVAPIATLSKVELEEQQTDLSAKTTLNPEVANRDPRSLRLPTEGGAPVVVKFDVSWKK